MVRREALTGADWILQRLLESGVSTGFGIVGGAIAHLFDAVYRSEGKFTLIPTAGEQGAGFMAEGFQRAGGAPFGVVMATSGPGALNCATSVANSFYDSVPVLFLCGQVGTQVARRPYSHLRQRGFQEAPVADVFKPISKFSLEVTDLSDLEDALESAIDSMLIGRRGPAVLSIPTDILSAQTPATWPARVIVREIVPPPDPDRVLKLMKALEQSKRPVIIVGAGCLDHQEALRGFAKYFGIPVFVTWGALEIAPEDWEFYGGRLGTFGGGAGGRNFGVQNSDFALVLGCRISGRLTGGNTTSFLRGARAAHGIWHVDCDRAVLAELEQDVPHRETIHSYVGQFLEQAIRLGSPRVEPPSGWPAWLDQVRDWRSHYGAVELHGSTLIPKGTVNPYSFVNELSQAAPANAVIVSECGGDAVILHQAWEAKRGQRIFSNHGGSAMGQGLGLGVGAALAAPDRPVLCFIGDGGFTLGAAELNTIRIQANNLRNLRVFVLNNRELGITRSWQTANTQGRYIACGPEPETGWESPDILAVANAYGVSAGGIYRLGEDWIDLPDLLVLPGPVIIDVPCPGWETYAPAIRGWAVPVEEMSPPIPEKAFSGAMRFTEPLPGWRERRGAGSTS